MDFIVKEFQSIWKQFVQQVIVYRVVLIMDMDMLRTLPRHLNTKDLSNDANALAVPAAAAAAFQLSTNFLNAVSIHFHSSLYIYMNIYIKNKLATSV